MNNFEAGPMYDYYEKDIPHKGKPFEENGKVVYWNMANEGDTVEEVLEYNNNGMSPIDAKEIDTPNGKVVIVKWEVVEK